MEEQLDHPLMEKKVMTMSLVVPAMTSCPVVWEMMLLTVAMAPFTEGMEWMIFEGDGIHQQGVNIDLKFGFGKKSEAEADRYKSIEN